MRKKAKGLLADGEPAPEVYSAAVTRDQANHVLVRVDQAPARA